MRLRLLAIAFGLSAVLSPALGEPAGPAPSERTFLCDEIRSADACWSDTLIDELQSAIAREDHDFANEAAGPIAERMKTLHDETMASVDQLCAEAGTDAEAEMDAELRLACLADTAVLFCPLAEALKKSGADIETVYLITLFFPDYSRACADESYYRTFADVLAARDLNAWAVAQRELVGSYVEGEVRRDLRAQAGHLDAAVGPARKSRVPRVLAWYLTERAGLQLDRGHLERAGAALDNADPVAHMAGDSMGISNVAILRGWLAAAENKPDTAVRYFREAIRVQADSSWRGEIGDLLLDTVIGITYARAGMCDDALPILADASERIAPYLPQWHRIRRDIAKYREECGSKPPDAQTPDEQAPDVEPAAPDNADVEASTAD